MVIGRCRPRRPDPCDSQIIDLPSGEARIKKGRSNPALFDFQSQSADNAGVKQKTDPSIDEARLAGFDLNLIEINLSLSPEERWRQHDMALAVIQDFEQARLARDARLPKSITPTR